MKITELESADQLAELQKGFVLLDFYATWCQPCKMMATVLETYASDIPVVKIDIEKFQDIAIQHNVRGVPNLVLTNDDTTVATKTGYLKDAELQVFLDTNT